MTNLNPSGSQPPWYVTTAIPYVNGKPHIGFAQEIILTDALARYHRLKGDDVWFLTGTDENAFKNVQSAEQEGIPTRELVDTFRSVGFRHARTYIGARGKYIAMPPAVINPPRI